MSFEERLTEKNSFELKFIAPEKLIDAVVYADVSYVDSTLGAEEGSRLLVISLTPSLRIMPRSDSRVGATRCRTQYA